MSVETNHLGQAVGAPLRGWKPPSHPEASVMSGRFGWLEKLDADKHAQALFAASKGIEDEAAWTYLPYGPFTDLAVYRDWLGQMSCQQDPLFFAIMDEKTASAVGVVAYLRIQPSAGAIEIGHLYFSPCMRRSALGTEAIYLLMERAFASGYRRCEWKCDALNEPSRRAAERLGFTFEGVFRQATVVRDRNRDTAWFAIIDGDWPRLQAGYESWLAAANFDENGQQKARLSELLERERVGSRI